MIRVYPASKIATAKMWREMDWPHVLFVARWLKHNLIGTPDEESYAAGFWSEDEEDVRAADVILVYAPPGQHLKGALVEAGMGIALGKPIIVVGDHPDYGTWQFHPRVQRVFDLDAAMEVLQHMDKYPQPLRKHG